MSGIVGRIRPDRSYDVFIRNRVQAVVESSGDGTGYTYWTRQLVREGVISEGWEKPVSGIDDDAADRFLVLDCPDFLAEHRRAIRRQQARMVVLAGIVVAVSVSALPLWLRVVNGVAAVLLGVAAARVWWRLR